LFFSEKWSKQILILNRLLPDELSEKEKKKLESKKKRAAKKKQNQDTTEKKEKKGAEGEAAPVVISGEELIKVNTRKYL